MSSSPASFMTYWSRTSSFGCSATIAAPRLGGPGPAFERGEVGGGEHPVEPELQERRGALDRLHAAPSGSSRHTSAGSRPGGQVGHLELDLVLLLPLVPLLRRALAGGVGVVGEHHLAGEVLQHLEVVVGQRGAARGDRVRRRRRARTPSRRCSPRRSRPRRARRSRPSPSSARRATGSSGRSASPASSCTSGRRRRARGRRSPTGVAARGRRSGTSAGRGTGPAAGSTLFTNASPASTMSSRANFCCWRCTLSASQPSGDQPSWNWRAASPSKPRDCAGSAAPIPPSSALEQAARGRSDRRARPLRSDRCLRLRSLATALVVVAQRDARARREPLDRVDEVEVLDLADERDRVAARLAAEAVVHAGLGVDRERRRLLGVERAEADEAAARPASARGARWRARRGRWRRGPAPRPRRGCPSGRCYGRSAPRRAGGSRRSRRQTPRGRSSGRQPSSSTPRPSAKRSVIPLT